MWNRTLPKSEKKLTSTFLPSLGGEEAFFLIFLWVRSLYQFIHDVVVNMSQYEDEEKHDYKHLETVGNLTEMQENNYGFERQRLLYWIVLGLTLIYKLLLSTWTYLSNRVI